MKDSFNLIDENQDGTLSREELSNGLDKLKFFEIMQSENLDADENDGINEIMKMCDLDGDGKIDYHEFIQAAIDHKALLNKENIQSIFNIFDQNGDGVISI